MLIWAIISKNCILYYVLIVDLRILIYKIHIICLRCVVDLWIQISEQLYLITTVENLQFVHTFYNLLWIKGFNLWKYTVHKLYRHCFVVSFPFLLNSINLNFDECMDDHDSWIVYLWLLFSFFLSFDFNPLFKSFYRILKTCVCICLRLLSILTLSILIVHFYKHTKVPSTFGLS